MRNNFNSQFSIINMNIQNKPIWQWTEVKDRGHAQCPPLCGMQPPQSNFLLRNPPKGSGESQLPVPNFPKRSLKRTPAPTKTSTLELQSKVSLPPQCFNTPSHIISTTAQIKTHQHRPSLPCLHKLSSPQNCSIPSSQNSPVEPSTLSKGFFRRKNSFKTIETAHTAHSTTTFSTVTQGKIPIHEQKCIQSPSPLVYRSLSPNHLYKKKSYPFQSSDFQEEECPEILEENQYQTKFEAAMIGQFSIKEVLSEGEDSRTQEQVSQALRSPYFSDLFSKALFEQQVAKARTLQQPEKITQTRFS